jgi:Glycosyl hydrolases family 38 C-terminal domain.
MSFPVDDKKLLSNVEVDEASGERIIRYHPTTTFSLTFLANLNPNEKATYLGFYNNPKAEKPNYSSDLKVSGQGLGKIIENKYYKVTLNRKSGVIYEITEKNTGLRLEHKLETNGSIHWNPDVYSPPHSWYHTSDWENPPYHQIEGPIFILFNLLIPCLSILILRPA